MKTAILLSPAVPGTLHTTRHPVLGCRCGEGRIYAANGDVEFWCPPVHDCAYIHERNERLKLT